MQTSDNTLGEWEQRSAAAHVPRERGVSSHLKPTSSVGEEAWILRFLWQMPHFLLCALPRSVSVQL